MPELLLERYARDAKVAADDEKLPTGMLYDHIDRLQSIRDRARLRGVGVRVVQANEILALLEFERDRRLIGETEEYLQDAVAAARDEEEYVEELIAA